MAAALRTEVPRRGEDTAQRTAGRVKRHTAGSGLWPGVLRAGPRASPGPTPSRSRRVSSQPYPEGPEAPSEHRATQAHGGGPARQTLLSGTLHGGPPLPLGPCGPGGGRLAPHTGHFLLRFRKTGSRRLPSQDPSPCTPALGTRRSASPSLCLPPARYSRRAPGNGPPVGTADAGPSFLVPALGAEGSLHSGIE